MTAELKRYIKKPNANVYRKAKIKRRNSSTGLFESDWLDISSDVKTYGKIVQSIDPARPNTFAFANTKLVMKNDEGFYNPEDNEASLWYGYLNQERTLVQIEVGFVRHTLGSSGQWINQEFPSGAYYDAATFDSETSLYDDSASSVQFTGIISGDIALSDKNEVAFNIKPLTSVFQEFPANVLTGWTSTGMTASQFVTMLRDQTDGSGSFVFRPFFGNTSTGFNITATTNVYASLNAATSAAVIDKTVWDIITKLAEAENYIPYVSKRGTFNFVPRTPTADVEFEFYGAGYFNSEYGQTIKSIQSYGRKITKYYSQVNVKFADANTATSYYTKTASFSVSGSNSPWTLGLRKLDIENLFIGNTATAQTIGDSIFTEYSALKNEITFKTSFVPQLEILDRIAIYYDPSDVNIHSLWDQNDWANDTETDLVWDSSRGDAIKIQGTQFNFLSIELDPENFENTFIAREI
jgi:hypothetical protein